MKIVLRFAMKVLRQSRTIRRQDRQLRQYGAFMADMQQKACKRAKFLYDILGLATPRGGE